MLKIINVVGTRPNFIKIAPLIKEMRVHKNIKYLLVHTGQHYDTSMSNFFFEELQIPKPDANLGVGSDSDARQTAEIMLAFEKVLVKEKPDLVVVVGDVNSTLAAALTAKKCGIKVAHVEAGLRSFDAGMPEEINRIITDHLSDFLFTTEESGNRNLINEGIPKNKIFFVGNIMIDTLLSHKEKAKKSKILPKLKLAKNNYAVLTLHRPSNVDSKKPLQYLISIIEKIQQKIKIVFPVHPRTMKNIGKFKLKSRIKNMANLTTIDPLGYLDFLNLMSNSKFVITDSGGIQEETTILNVPCITLRNNTERPVTLNQGTNVVVSTDERKVVDACSRILNGCKIKGKIPELWDGRASKRIMYILQENLGHSKV